MLADHDRVPAEQSGFIGEGHTLQLDVDELQTMVAAEGLDGLRQFVVVKDGTALPGRCCLLRAR
jgi:hypothetical protein